MKNKMKIFVRISASIFNLCLLYLISLVFVSFIVFAFCFWYRDRQFFAFCVNYRYRFVLDFKQHRLLTLIIATIQYIALNWTNPYILFCWLSIKFLVIQCRGGVFKDFLSLEDTIWSPWPWPWSLQVLENALFSALGQHYFLTSWKLAKVMTKFVSSWRTQVSFFFFFWRSLSRCVLVPWPRAFLSLASRGSVLKRAALGLGFFLCPWPWPRALCPRLHLWSNPPISFFEFFPLILLLVWNSLEEIIL